MSRNHDNHSSTRSWRDIPQQVQPRARSRGGRRRVWQRSLKTTLAVVVVVLLLGLVWAVAEALQEQPGGPARTVGASPVREIALATDGVLDRAWITNTLALPRTASLMELDLQQLRDRLLRSGQVRTATVARHFPATLAVTLAERTPVVRVLAQLSDGATRELLVARDGVVYAGAGYEPAMIGSLLWLDGVKLVRIGDRFQPVAGMEPAADLLAKARNEAPHLYATWKVISLARLDSDAEIQVQSAAVDKITFSAAEDFFRQLAQLDVLIDTGQPLREVNLAVGRTPDGGIQVPVSLAVPAPPATSLPAGPTPLFIPFNHPQKTTTREL